MKMAFKDLDDDLIVPIAKYTQITATREITERFIGMKPDDAQEGEVFWSDTIKPQHYDHAHNTMVGAAHVAEYFLRVGEMLTDIEHNEDSIQSLMADPTWTRERNPFWQGHKDYLLSIIHNINTSHIVHLKLIEVATQSSEHDEVMLRRAYELSNKMFDLYPAIVYCFWEALPSESWLHTHHLAMQQWQMGMLAMQNVIELVPFDEWKENL